MLPYPLNLMEQLHIQNDSRLLLIVLDGVGDVAIDGKTPLSAARTPNLDALAHDAALGLSTPVAPGIAPGSGPGHLSLFGYDPIQYQVGRGVLSALGISLDLQPGQVASRGNFATIDADGKIADRRAGRIDTDLNERLLSVLREEITIIEDVQIELHTVSEYRFVLILSGPALGGGVNDTDPGRVGSEPLPAAPLDDRAGAEKTARIINEFRRRAEEVLQQIPEAQHHDPPVTTVLTRGVDTKPDLPDFERVYGLTAGAIASYPMYRGVARLVGMELLPMDLSGDGERTPAKLDAYRTYAASCDYVYFHVKKIDSYGEDGNFEKKAEQIEDFDAILPDLMAWDPDVVLITGDHSTPVIIKAHSWHPLPVLLHSAYVRRDGRRFTEEACRSGSLGQLQHIELMPLVMANARRLSKYGA